MPEQASNEECIRHAAANALGITARRVLDFRIDRKTVDARQRKVIIDLAVTVGIDTMLKPQPEEDAMFNYHDVSQKEPVIVVGAGPAGLFAALRLIELGQKPIVLERGEDVTSRKKRLATMVRKATWDKQYEDSNYCFGEGGAGTFSDGKLYTRSNKRGSIDRILHIFHLHGAQDSILTDAHPHIGTDRLSTVIKNMRQRIIECGGEVHFRTKMTTLLTSKKSENHTAHIIGVRCKQQLENGNTCTKEWMAKRVILATGHSARDVYELLANTGVKLECKGFAMGVRVEHPQELIDQQQYHSKHGRGKYLPAASYSFVAHANERGVYSFCMCPGGQIVPATTGDKEIVVNGMSNSSRSSSYANSGILVEIRPEDLPDYTPEHTNPLIGLDFQKRVEQLAYVNNGHLQNEKSLKAPAQRLDDFVTNRLSNSLPHCSYLPGVESSPLHEWLPKAISSRLQEGFKQFDKKMHGFLTNEALIVGVESRSSSPVRIPRDKDTLQHVEVKGLYPCGEGAGYSGGITSSAIDGERCAEAAARLSNED